jgi:hypothetical protein
MRIDMICILCKAKPFLELATRTTGTFFAATIAPDR